MEALRLIAIDPGTDGGHCPATFIVAPSGDLLFQGPEVTSEKELAAVDGLSPIGPDETVVRIPARMRTVLLRALLEAEAVDADTGTKGLR